MKPGILFLSLLYCVTLNAQYPARYVSQVTNVGSTVMEEGDNAHTEVPPWMITQSGPGVNQYFLTNGSQGYLGYTPSSQNFITSSTLTVEGLVNNVIYNPALVTSPLTATESCPTAIAVSSTLTLSATTTGINKATSSLTMSPGFTATGSSGTFMAEIVNGLASGQDWKRNYYGIYTAQSYTDPVQGLVTLGFIHAENKMYCYNSGTMCNGSINPYISTYNSSATPYECPPPDFWPLYAGFLCAAWNNDNSSNEYGSSTFNDLGPIAWPSTGYLLPSGQKTSLGLTVPSSIIYNGYVYVFFVDNSPYQVPTDPSIPYQEGEIGGIKVVRAPISNALNPSVYQTYYKDPSGNVYWNPSLPPGFDKNNIDAFWSTPGPKSTDLMGSTLATGVTALEHRFSVAQVRSSNYFAGVEQYSDVNGSAYPLKTAIRFSYDLLNWSPRQIIDSQASYSTLLINYPILISSDGSSNNLVDSTDFYVLGTPGDGAPTSTTNKFHVYLSRISDAVKVMKTVKVTADTTGTTDSDADAGSALSGPAGLLPNPGHGYFRIGYTLHANAAVQVNVYDITGRLVKAGNLLPRQAGYYQDEIDLTGRTSGVYLVELVVNGRKTVYKALNE